MINIVSVIKGMGSIYMGLLAKKLIIHIGMPKTGSSAIQALMGLNEAYFLKHKVAFPWYEGFTQSYQTSGGNADKLITWLNNNDRDAFDSAIKDIEAETVIISSETLFYSFKKNPTAFFDFFVGYDFTVVCYVRDLVQLIDSSLNQAVKNHGFFMDNEHLNHIIEDCNYLGLLTRCASYARSGHLLVRWYDKKKFGSQGIYTDFLDSVGMDVDLTQLTFPNKVVNPSLSPGAFLFRCMLNSFSSLPKSNAFNYQVNALLARYSVELSNTGSILNTEQITRIKSAYKDSFKLFWRTFWETPAPEIGEAFIKPQQDERLKQERLVPIISIKQILNFIRAQDLELLLIILSSFVKSDQSSIYQRRILLKVIKQELIPLWLNDLNTKVLTESESSLCGLLRMFSTLELSVDGNTFPYSIKQWSEDVASYSQLGGGVVIESIANDPFFELVKLEVFNHFHTSVVDKSDEPISAEPNVKGYWVWLELKVPCAGVVQLYYTTQNQPDFSSDTMLSVNVLAGEHNLSFLIDDPEFTGQIRVDPGSDAGLYLVRQLHVYSFNCE